MDGGGSRLGEVTFLTADKHITQLRQGDRFRLPFSGVHRIHVLLGVQRVGVGQAGKQHPQKHFRVLGKRRRSQGREIGRGGRQLGISAGGACSKTCNFGRISLFPGFVAGLRRHFHPAVVAVERQGKHLRPVFQVFKGGECAHLLVRGRAGLGPRSQAAVCLVALPQIILERIRELAEVVQQSEIPRPVGGGARGIKRLGEFFG